jgi:hypothetical protein
MNIPESNPEDPKTKIRLSTIQGVGLSIEHKIEIAKTELHRAQGVVAGLTAAAMSEIPATMTELAKLVRGEECKPEDQIPEDAGKLALTWLQKARERVETAARLNGRNVAKQEGVIEGLTKSVDECETLFRQEVAKAQRRENEADRGRRDDGGRPISLREQRSEAPAVAPEKPKRTARKRAN